MSAWSTPSQPTVDLGGALPNRTTRVRSVSLSGPAGQLEALLNEGAPAAPYAALVCHPHPLGGGTLHNKVVYHAMKVLNDVSWGFGFPVLRFNFRGTGLSEGVHDGEAETDDVLAALEWLDREFHLPLVAVGFSFGAAMTIAALSSARGRNLPVRALVALGLPLEASGRIYSYPGLASLTLPKLFLSGDSDPFAPAEQLARVTALAATPQQLALIAGADHFFTGRIEPMQQALAGWLLEHLP
jgi:uncharacterized protein